jgi:hypothetical protein
VDDSSIRLDSGGVPVGVDHATLVNWPGVDAVLTVGSPVDLWGVAWTPALINSPTFGVRIAIDNQNANASGFVGCASLQVYFTPPAVTGRGFLLRGVSRS